MIDEGHHCVDVRAEISECDCRIRQYGGVVAADFQSPVGKLRALYPAAGFSLRPSATIRQQQTAAQASAGA
jgi:hypothetical protein